MTSHKEQLDIYANLLYDKTFDKLSIKQKNETLKLRSKSVPKIKKGVRYVSKHYPNQSFVYDGRDERGWWFVTYKGNKKLGYLSYFDRYGLKLLRRK